MLHGTDTEPSLPVSSRGRKFVAPLLIALLMLVGYLFGLHHYLTLQSIADNRAALEAYAADHWLLALLAFMAVYVAVVALSFPGASVLTVVGGLLFGWMVAGPAVIVSATLGSTIIFLAVRSALADSLVKRSGPLLGKIVGGFSRDAFSYLLFLRLLPVFPFWLVNISAAVANLRLRSFVLATAIGIIPATLVFAYVGEGLDSVIEAQQAAHATCVAANGGAACPFTLSVASLVTRELLIAFAALGVLALAPVVLRSWRPHP